MSLQAIGYCPTARKETKIPYGLLGITGIFCNFVSIDQMQSRMEQPSEQSLWGMLEGITENLKHKRLADVFRFVPEVFSRFNPDGHGQTKDLAPVTIFSEENRLIKIVNNVRIMRAVQRIVNEMNQKSKYYQYLVVMYYAELLILIYRYLDEAYLPICTNDSLKKAISYIRLNYQSDITISDVASQTGVGERYLRKLFSQYLNLSPLDYLNQIRINKAIELLRNTEMSVKEVCFACGFQSPQYFSRIFKQQMGISPREVTK